MENQAPEREGEFSPGDVCEGYRIVSLLAKGGMGDVYEAAHEATGRVVALKCLKVKHLRKDDARARMKMEAIVLSELQHANLVQVFDAGVNDLGMVWIAMERLHGQTLRQLLHRAGRLSIPEALFYASEIAEGVDAVHEVNVIHRDLKPENVFVTRRNEVKVLDLGTGKFAGYSLNNTDRMKVVGTTAYMSPEQIRGLRIDARADVYALGLMVYEMIAGRHPLAREGSIGLTGTPEQIALLQLEAIPPKLSDVAAHCPAYVVRIVEQAIAKDREGRHPTMAVFGRELRVTRKRFIAERGTSAPSGAGIGKGERLRDKFGASPLPSSRPASDASDAAPTVVPSGREAIDDLQLGNTMYDPFPPDSPVARHRQASWNVPPSATGHDRGGAGVATAGHEPTLLLSGSAEFLPSSDVAARAADRRGDDVPNRTTNTNPLALLRPAELTPEPHSLPDFRRRAPLWSRPGVRRTALTLGLGALIGIPPAVVSVFWRAHRHAAAPTTSIAATSISLAAAPPAVELPAATGVEVPDPAPAVAVEPASLTTAASKPNPQLAASVAGRSKEPHPWRATPRAAAPATGIPERAARAAPVLAIPNFPAPSAQPAAGEPKVVLEAPPAPPAPSPVALPPSGL